MLAASGGIESCCRFWTGIQETQDIFSRHRSEPIMKDAALARALTDLLEAFSSAASILGSLSMRALVARMPSDDVIVKTVVLISPETSTPSASARP